MKNRIFSIVLVTIMNASCYFADAQNSPKKPEKVFPCGCVITKIEGKCGLCGGILEADLKSIRRQPNGIVICDYICSKDHNDAISPSPHIHKNVSNEYEYVHKCTEGNCLVVSKETNNNGETEWLFTNTCKVKKYYSLTISAGNEKVVIDMLRPNQTKKSPVNFPENANITISIRPREGFDILLNAAL